MDDIVKQQEEKRRNELDALQSQINPHFLYNTLDSIIWMVESERYEEAISMVTALANLFRISLSQGRTIITVKEEFNHAKNYSNIQKVRFKNKFEVTFMLDEKIEKYLTIKLIIQPLLENAIYYGMEAMDGDGEILVQGYEQGDSICIDVIDNGSYVTYETQGDNEEYPDERKVAPGDIISVYTGVRLPLLGYIITFLSGKLGFFLCIVLPVLLYTIWQVYKLVIVIMQNQKEKILEEAQAQTSDEVKQAIINEYLAKQKELEKTKQEENEKSTTD